MADYQPLMPRGNRSRRARVGSSDQQPSSLSNNGRPLPSLIHFCQDSIFDWLKALVGRSTNTFWHNAGDHRDFLSENVVSHLRQGLLDRIIHQPRDSWTFTCQAAKGRLRCKLHRECILLHEKLERYIFLLFSFDSSALTIDFRKMDLKSHVAAVKEVLFVLEDRRLLSNGVDYHYMPNLTELILKGGTSHTDAPLADIMERVSASVATCTPCLKVLHLPMVGDCILSRLANHPTLQCFLADRAIKLTNEGFEALSAPSAATRNNLRVLEVFSCEPRPRYRKADLCSFIQKMSNLSNFSMHDEKRALVSTDSSTGGNLMFKPATHLVYSGYRLCLVDEMLEQLEQKTAVLSIPSGSHDCNKKRLKRADRFDCKLDHLQIVDCQVKPEYLTRLERLNSLYIDWQEELSGSPWELYSREWFSEMVKNPAWAEVAGRLHTLEVVFPSVYSENSYSMLAADTPLLMQSCSNLTTLKLKGAGMYGDFLNLNAIIKGGPNLRTLVLNRCDIHVDPLPWDFKNFNLTSFKFVGGKVTSMALLVSLIRTTMPKLTDLMIQPDPKAPEEFCCTVSPMELCVLGEMPDLRNVSVAISSPDFTSNMTSMFAILTGGFAGLHNFNIGWYFAQGRPALSSNNDIVYKMSWLKQFLRAENCHVNIGLDYYNHKSIFEASKVRNDNMDAFVNF